MPGLTWREFVHLHTVELAVGAIANVNLFLVGILLHLPLADQLLAIQLGPRAHGFLRENQNWKEKQNK